MCPLCRRRGRETNGHLRITSSGARLHHALSFKAQNGRSIPHKTRGGRGVGIHALRGSRLQSVRTRKTVQPAVFPFTERLLPEGVGRPLSVAATASRPVRRMVVQSNPYAAPHTRQTW